MDEPDIVPPTLAEPLPEIESGTMDENSATPPSQANAESDPTLDAAGAPTLDPERVDTVPEEVRAELEGIQETLARIVGGLNDLQTSFDSKLKYDASKERMVDMLHKELQAYRDDLHFKILRPLFVDLIHMHDDIASLLKHRDAESMLSESERSLKQSVLTFQDTIEDILERNGVTLYTEDGAAFVPQRQRALKTVETADAERDSQIAERVRKGFEYAGRVLRPEIVFIFKFKPVAGQAASVETNKGV